METIIMDRGNLEGFTLLPMATSSIALLPTKLPAAILTNMKRITRRRRPANEKEWAQIQFRWRNRGRRRGNAFVGSTFRPYSMARTDGLIAAANRTVRRVVSGE